MHEFEGPEPDVRTMLERIVFTKEVWTAAIGGRDIPPRDKRSIADLQARLSAVQPQLTALVRRIRDRNEWDDVFVDALCTPPVSFTLGSVIAHILTVGVIRRQTVIDALRELSTDVESRDPIEWERAITARRCRTRPSDAPARPRNHTRVRRGRRARRRRRLRAAVVTLAPFYLATALHRPELAWTALGGWLGTLVDPGGSRATRARALAAFGVVGAAWVALSEAAAGSPPVAAALLAATAFAAAIARGVDATAGSVGTMVAMVAAIGASRSRGVPARDAEFFALGAAQAVLLSSVIWPVWTRLPERRAIARAYGALSTYASEAASAEVLAAPPGDTRYGALIRLHHRRIREAIDAARQVALAARSRREGETRFGSNVRVLLGAAEAQLWLLGTLLRRWRPRSGARAAPAARLAGIAAVYAELERILIARAIRSRAPSRRVPDPIRRAPRRRPQGPSPRASKKPPTTRSISPARWTRPRRRTRIEGPPSRSAQPAPSTLRALGQALRDALSPGSVALAHGVRAACAVTVASLVGSVVSPSRAYWVTLTAIAVLQPYVGSTFQRALERALGTVLGSAVAAAIIVGVRSPAALATLMVPLSVAAVATRPRSYRLFTFFLTPVFVLLAERHMGDWWTAAMRVGDVAVGGAIALAASLLVLPSSERARLPDALARMLDAVGAYAHTALAAAPETEGSIVEVRRAAAAALGAAEASLERLLSEPLADRKAAEDAMLLVTYARRLATALTALGTLETMAPADVDARAEVAAYVAQAVTAAEAHLRGERTDAAPQAPERVVHPALERVVRQAALVASVAPQG